MFSISIGRSNSGWFQAVTLLRANAAVELQKIAIKSGCYAIANDDTMATIMPYYPVQAGHLRQETVSSHAGFTGYPRALAASGLSMGPPMVDSIPACVPTLISEASETMLLYRPKVGCGQSLRLAIPSLPLFAVANWMYTWASFIGNDAGV